MLLYDEIYFEITLRGASVELQKFVSFLNSGELDEFFEISSEYINLDETQDGGELIFTNDELGVEIDEFDVEEFLDIFCKAAKALDIRGSFYDNDDNNFSFSSPAADAAYYDSDIPCRFNDELDEAAREEEAEEE